MNLAALLLSTCVLASEPGFDTPIAPPPSPQRSRRAIEGGLGYLKHEGLKWIQERQCASCHHATWLMWAVHEARQAGVAIDESGLADVNSFCYAADNRAKLIAAPGAMGADKLSMGAVYLGLATDPEQTSDPIIAAALSRVAAEAISKQEADGSWSAPAGRPPLFDSKEATTLLSYLTLSSPALRNVPDQSSLGAAQEKALAWLDSQPDEDSLQSDALRVVVLVRRQAPADKVTAAIDRLLGWQRADGGFPQSHDRPSDALATGEALYGLASAGVADHDPAVTRAAAYLVNTQRADGSWSMTSRPTQPGGNGANLLGPITFVGTAWATIGLARASHFP
jgi:hypothetical protein